MFIERHAGSLASAGTILGLAVAAGGLVSFCGWAFDVPRLTDWFGNGVSIQPNTAVLLMLSGAALVTYFLGPRSVVAALGGFIALAGAATLAQYVVGADFGFNHPLMFGREWGQYTTVSPGRMGPPASTSFTLFGLSFLLLGLRRFEAARIRRIVPLLAVAVGVITLLSLTGHLVGAEHFYTVPWLTAIALQTALMLAAAAAGIVLCVPDQQPLRLLLSDTGAGSLARRMLPVLIVLPPLMGWLRERGEILGYYDTGTGRAILILGITVLSVALLWSALLALARQEAAERRNAHERLREQQRIADALREADQRKTEFLAILAHELRGPLAPLANALELLKQPGLEAAAAARARAIMDRQLGHLARLVDDLLDVSRITRDRIEIRREPVDLRALLESCVDTVRAAAGEKSQELRLELPADPIPLDGDPVRLTQVFSNVLQNATKYTGVGGRIACTARIEGGEAVVTVADDGAGIPAAHLATVFEMFRQLDPGADRVRGGLGIGLTLARRLVELHGGTIRAASDGAGRGSTFVVRLPVRAESRDPPAPREPQVPRAPLRFLVADDNPDTASSLAALLESHGHAVHTATDGLEAVEMAARTRPDVVLLDIGMPRLDGCGACRQIRAEPWGRRLLVVALTGWGQDAARRDALEAGFDHHLVKPVEFGELMSLVAARTAREPAA